ncbi:TraB pilus assembly family protein [Burkholderiales bacterium GJ-E10]|nr:TraB pilus assembly family protein [Burkholderiales bacterium GJ-E10]
MTAAIACAPIGALHAAGNVAATGSAQFGAAIPTEQFIQSFQRKVTEQMQRSLTQSSHEQEQRLRAFESRQRAQLDAELSRRLGAMQQSLRPSSDGEPQTPVAAPRVHVRRAAVAGDAPAAESKPDAEPEAEPDIVPNGFIRGTLLNGVVAIVGGSDRESLVALHGRYRSANGFSSDLDGCFALVQGRPEIAAGRIDFKLARLTCTFPDGASRTWDTAGWLVDRDGIRGVRATIVENLGRKTLVAAAGGALSGYGQRLSQEQYQYSAMAMGASANFVGSPMRDATGGAAVGASNALTQSINDYYNLYSPSLQVGGGTPVTVVLANDLRVPASGRAITPTHIALP